MIEFDIILDSVCQRCGLSNKFSKYIRDNGLIYGRLFQSEGPEAVSLM